MSEKVLLLSQSVYELCKQYPELSQMLHDLGFTDITKPGMLASVGRFMTIPKGAIAKKMDLDQIKQYLEDHGFEVRSE